MKHLVRFRLDFSAVCSLGPGKIELVEGIHKAGSLRQAALALSMSYRRAWVLLDGLNHSFSEPAATPASADTAVAVQCLRRSGWR